MGSVLAERRCCSPSPRAPADVRPVFRRGDEVLSPTRELRRRRLHGGPTGPGAAPRPSADLSRPDPAPSTGALRHLKLGNPRLGSQWTDLQTRRLGPMTSSCPYSCPLGLPDPASPAAPFCHPSSTATPPTRSQHSLTQGPRGIWSGSLLGRGRGDGSTFPPDTPLPTPCSEPQRTEQEEGDKSQHPPHTPRHL